MNNNVFVNGSDNWGRTGLGYVHVCHFLTEISELSDKGIEQFFEGLYFMFARSETNDIYS